MAEKKDIDRAALERDYRAGVKSLRALGKEFGLSAPRIVVMAKAEGWTRDLSVKIQAAAEAKLQAEAINSSGANDGVNAANAKARKASENEVVEANAEAIKNIVLEHRTDITATRELALQMLNELRAQTNQRELFDQLAQMMSDPETGTDKLADVMRKVISLPSRADTLKKLTDTLKTLIDKEREAFNIGQTSGDDQISALKALFRESAQ